MKSDGQTRGLGDRLEWAGKTMAKRGKERAMAKVVEDKGSECDGDKTGLARKESMR